MRNDIAVGSTLYVKDPSGVEGLSCQAKVRKIGMPGGGFVMLTLDIQGNTHYAVARESELARG